MSTTYPFEEYNKFNLEEENLKSKGIKRLKIIEGFYYPMLFIEKTSYIGFEKNEETIKGKDKILNYLKSL